MNKGDIKGFEDASALDKKSAKHRSKLNLQQVKRVIIVLSIGLSIFMVIAYFVRDELFSYIPVFSLTFLAIAALSLFFELLDSSTGMGFGTTLSPILLLMGFDPLEIVPVLLISESISGISAAILHNEFQNYNISVRPLNEITSTAIVLFLFGAFGIILSIVLTYFAFEIPKEWIKLYVAILIIIIALTYLFKRKLMRRKYEGFRIRKLWPFGLIAGINKGIGGGGYGPVVTLGEFISGIHPKSAIAVTSLAEGAISIIGVITFIVISYSGVKMNLLLLPVVFLGSLIGSVISPYIVRVIPGFVWRFVVPIYALVIGILMLLQISFGKLS